MAPMKKRKGESAATKATPKLVGSDKKPLKRLHRKGKATESLPTEASSEEVVSEKKILEDAKSGEVKESDATPVVKKKKPCTWLKLYKLDSLIGSKSVQNSKLGNDAKGQNSKQDKEANVQNFKQGKETNVQNSKQGREASFPNSKQGKETNIQSHKQGKEANFPNSKRGERNFNNKNRNGTNIGDRNFDETRVDSPYEKKDKRIVNERHEDAEKSDDEYDRSLGGIIFMCNAKTKPDCLGYKLMGVPANKKEVVMGIKPGLTLFLYDYDFKLLYGIYKASSTGGMKLEPSAFGGGFPAQVRFTVHKDCLPLPENVFKKALKDSYDERTHKFKTELTVKQVKCLTDLFQPTPWLQPDGPSLVNHRDLTLLDEESMKEQKYLYNNFSDYNSSSSTVPSREPRFLTEQEYRNYGLRHENQRIDSPFTNVSSEVQQREVSQHDPFFLGEKDYRTYGLSGPHQIHNALAPRVTTSNARDPYDDSTESLVNRYLSLPMKTGLSSEPYPLAGREPYMNDLYRATDVRICSERSGRPLTSYEQLDVNGRPYSFYGYHEASELNQGVRLQSESNLTSAPVSQRYSFAGPSLSQHR